MNKGMMRFGEDGNGCLSCHLYGPHDGCIERLKPFVLEHKDGCCTSKSNKFYANKSQLESILSDYEGIPRGSRKDLTFQCPDCESANCYGPEKSNQRVCRKCDRIWYTDVNYRDNNRKDHDFRVGDPVTVIGKDGEMHQYKETVVSSTKRGKPFKCYPIGVKISEYRTTYFRADGTQLNGALSLHHGHNLKVIVEEKKPVRTVVKWVFLYHINTGSVKISDTFISKAGCLEAISGYETIESYSVISKPIEVHIPG